MSDPVSNVEIEDVLSSIRRLVSTEHRDMRAYRDEERTEDADRLVLTPSLRVDPDTVSDESSEDEADLSDSPEDTQAIEQADALSLGEWTTSDEGEAVDHLHWADAAESTDANDDPALSEDETVLSQPEDFSDEQPGDASGVEEAVNDTGPEQNWSSDAENSVLSEVSELNEETTLDRGPEIEPEESRNLRDDGKSEGIGTEPEIGDAVAGELEARIAEVEAAVAARDDEWEPDGEVEETYIDSPVSRLPWADAAEEDSEHAAAFDQKPEAAWTFGDQTPAASEDPLDVQENDEDEGADETKTIVAGAGQQRESTWYSEDAVIDEEALRDLVSDIVRQELQGALGERITRNVRKLVRREIHRALMSQDFD